MAIDTAEKRKSISGISIPLIPGVTPNAAKDAEWRGQAGWNYSGITFGQIFAFETLNLTAKFVSKVGLIAKGKFKRV